MKINGEELECDELQFMQYLKDKNLKADCVALELNGTIISKEQFADLVLKKDDKAEVVSFVGGG